MDAEEQEEGNSTALSDTDNWEIQKVLFLLDKFYVSDQLKHEFTIAYDDMQRATSSSNRDHSSSNRDQTWIICATLKVSQVPIPGHNVA